MVLEPRACATALVDALVESSRWTAALASPERTTRATPGKRRARMVGRLRGSIRQGRLRDGWPCARLNEHFSRSYPVLPALRGARIKHTTPSFERSKMNRLLAINLVLTGILIGVLLTWSCAPGAEVPTAHAQTGGCVRYDVLIVTPMAETGVPTSITLPKETPSATVDSAKIAMPEGWEPFGGGDYGRIFLRKCAG
jgi:hypothetical protein